MKTIEEIREEILGWYHSTRSECYAAPDEIEALVQVVLKLVAAEWERCIALVELEIQSVEENKAKFYGPYMEGWLHALERLKFKFKGVE